MRYDSVSPAEEIKAHILLPKGKSCSELYVNDEKTSFEVETVGASTYVNADVLTEAGSTVSFEIIFA